MHSSTYRRVLHVDVHTSASKLAYYYASLHATANIHQIVWSALLLVVEACTKKTTVFIVLLDCEIYF